MKPLSHAQGRRAYPVSGSYGLKGAVSRGGLSRSTGGRREQRDRLVVEGRGRGGRVRARPFAFGPDGAPATGI